MNTFTICRHAASGCNYPEGEGLGLCARDKWEAWQGGECPEPAPVLVEYRMRCGLTVTRGATNKANKVRVTLATDDTYTVEFFNLRGVNCKPCGEPVERVYADRLQAVFTEQTGLDTHL